jgi:hypothetical protein
MPGRGMLEWLKPFSARARSMRGMWLFKKRWSSRRPRTVLRYLIDGRKPSKLQDNGKMLNDERMCTFIAKSRPLVGLVIDGLVRIMTG